MKTKKELIREYKDRRKTSGIYRIRNTASGRAYFGSSLDLDGVWNSHRFRLESGLHPSETLQRDWKELGPAGFVFEILETVKDADLDIPRVEEELALLEGIWIERLNASGETGYNTDTNLRRV
jgi:hypothetical protein